MWPLLHAGVITAFSILQIRKMRHKRVKTTQLLSGRGKGSIQKRVKLVLLHCFLHQTLTYKSVAWWTVFRETLEQSSTVFIWAEEIQESVGSSSHHSKGRRIPEGRSVVFMRKWPINTMRTSVKKQGESPACLENEAVLMVSSAVDQRHHDVCPRKISLPQLSLSALWLTQWIYSVFGGLRKDKTPPVENGSTVWSVWEMRFLGKWYFKCSNLRFSGKDAIGRFIFWICILGSTHAFLFWNFSRYSRGSLTRLWYLNIVKWWRQFLECRILLLPTASLLFIQGIWYCSQSLYEITFFKKGSSLKFCTHSRSSNLGNPHLLWLYDFQQEEAETLTSIFLSLSSG